MLARHVRLPFDRRTKTLASLACSGEAGARPLDNEIALELSDGAEHVVIYDNSDWPSVHDLPTAQKAKVLAPGPRQ